MVGLPPEHTGGERVAREHERAGQPHLTRQPPERGPGGLHPAEPLLAVAVGDPLAEPEHAHLLGRRRPPGEPEQVPAATQRRARLPGPGGLKANPGAERAADEQPHHEQRQAEPPAVRRQHDAGEHAGEPVADQRDQRHRRTLRLAAQQLAARGGEPLEHVLIFEVLDPRRRGHRLHQPALHQPVDPRRRRGRERVLERSAHQRQRVGEARERQRQDQPLPLRRGQPVRDGVRDRARDASHQDEHEHGQHPLGDDEHHRQQAQPPARLP